MSDFLEPAPSPAPDPVAGTRPTWWWRLEDAAGAEVRVPQVPASPFPSQSDAESWLGETWRELLEGGVDAVSLFEADRKVYGPMSLHAAS